MSNKQNNISKHRTGGPHGGQPQSNQRQQDYSRSNPADRFQTNTHNMRQPNTAVSSHMPVNMPTQTGQNALPQNPQNPMIRPYSNNNQPGLIQAQPINMAHMNNQTSVVPLINPQFSYLSQNRIRHPNMSPRNPVNSFQNYPAQLNQNYNQYPPYQFPTNIRQSQVYIQNQAMPFPFHPVVYISPEQVNQYRNYYSTQQTLNMTNPTINNDINVSNVQIPSSQSTIEKKKHREKNPAEVRDDEGRILDIEELAKKQQKHASTNTPDKTNEKTINSDEMPMNGANNKEIDSESKSTEENVIHETETSISESVSMSTDEHSNQDVELKKPYEDSSSCDINEIVADSTSNVQVPGINETQQMNNDIEELTDKVEQIALESQDSEEKSIADDIAAEEPVHAAEMVDDEANKTSEDIAPSRDENYTTCESIVSGDMDDVDDSDQNIHDETPTPDENQNFANSAPIDNDDDSDLNSRLCENAENRKYTREKVLSLRVKASKNALSNSNQENLKDILRGNSPSSSSDSLLPNWMGNKLNRSNDSSFRLKPSQNQQIYRQSRQSQPQKIYSDSKSRKITSTSLNNDEWRLSKCASTDPEEKKTDMVLKTVRSILNKLTPQNYQTLLTQFRSLKIDSRDRLQRVIKLIFEKAVLEPAFVVQYAGFCSELNNIEVVEEDENKQKVQVKFKNLLLTECQDSFYEKMYDNIDKDLIKQIEETEDPVKKKELEEQLDEEKRMARKRSVGNIKLIAELFKLGMLNVKIIMGCFDYLINFFFKQKHEEYIECLCALITNIGQSLVKSIPNTGNKAPENMKKFDEIFATLEKIHDQKLADIKVSPRTCFMILDLLDLRKSNWVPRRKAEGPKLISQVHEDMELQQRLKNESINEMKKKKNNAAKHHDPDQWQDQKRKHTNVPSKLNLNFLKNISEKNNISQPQNAFAAFSRFQSGSHGGSTPNSQSRSSSSNYESKNQISSNDKSQRVYHDSLNTKDQHNRRDERKVSDVTSYQMDKRSDSSSSLTKNNAFEFDDMVKKIFNNYLKSEVTAEDTLKNIHTICSKSSYVNFIHLSLNVTLEATSQMNPRQVWGNFLGRFFYECEPSDIFESLKNLFNGWEDYIMDHPKFFEFIGETLAHSLLYKDDGKEPNTKRDIIKSIAKAYREIVGEHCTKFRDSLLNTIKSKDENLYNEINPMFNPILTSNEFSKLDAIVKEFLKDNDLNYFKIQIEQNYADRITSEDFKSALFYTCIKLTCENEIINMEKVERIIQHFLNTEDDEVLLLISCSNFVEGVNHPPGRIQDIFNYINNKKLVAVSSFYKWENNKKPQGVTKSNLLRFFQNLNNESK